MFWFAALEVNDCTVVPFRLEVNWFPSASYVYPYDSRRPKP
jgi:hypothetical protein